MKEIFEGVFDFQFISMDGCFMSMPVLYLGSGENSAKFEKGARG